MIHQYKVIFPDKKEVYVNVDEDPWSKFIRITGIDVNTSEGLSKAFNEGYKLEYVKKLGV